MQFKFNPIIAGLTDRRAQTECIHAIMDTVAFGGKDFLAEMCVGAGKTNVGLAVMRQLKESFGSKSIVVVPSDNIRETWINDGRKDFGLNISQHFDTRAIHDLRDSGWGDLLDGLVISYQTLANNADVIEGLIRRLDGNVGVFMDECHHGGEGLSWGDAAIQAFALAKLRVGLTGTPYRHDTSPIPWVKYDNVTDDGPGITIPQYHYRYGDGLRDMVVAPISFKWVRGIVDRESNEGDELPLSFSFDDDYIDLPEAMRERYANKRLSIALDPTNRILTHDENGIVMQVIDSLADVRMSYHKAGAAVVCDNMAQLKALKDRFEECGLVVLFTTCKEASHDNVVARFNQGHGDVILSIRQLAEGVSIPRLQVLGLAMVITTQLFFTQVVGRLARLVKDLPYFRQHGTVVAMADHRFIEFAEAFKNPDLEVEQKNCAKRKDKKFCPECDHECHISAKVCPNCGYVFKKWPPVDAAEQVAVNGVAADSSMTVDGKTYSADEIQEFLKEMGDPCGDPNMDPYFSSFPLQYRIYTFIKARETLKKGAA